MTPNYFHQINAQTPTRMWVNNPTPAEAQAAIAAGAYACTTNPTYAARILAVEPQVGARLVQEAIGQTPDDQAAADLVQQKCVARILGPFAPLHAAGPEDKGLVSIQGNPGRDEDAGHIVTEALAYRRLGDNVVAKIPATQAGLAAMPAVLAAGIPVIATEVMSLAQARAAAEVEGRVRRATGRCPAFFITHITGIFDEYLAAEVKQDGIKVDPALLAKAGWLVCRQERGLLDQMGSEAILLGGGARSLRHFTDMVGGRLHVTINWSMAQELAALGPPVTGDGLPFGQAVDGAEAQMLCRLIPDFRRAYEAEALAPEEFADWGPVQHFRNMFLAGWAKVVAAVKEARPH